MFRAVRRAFAASAGLLVAAALGGFACVGHAAELVVNGSMEANGGAGTGTFAGWITSSQSGSSGGFLVQTGVLPPRVRFSVPPPPSGAFAAMSDQSAPGSHVLYQDIVIPPNASATFSARVFVQNQASDFHVAGALDYTVSPNQQVRVDVMNPAAPAFDTGAGVLRNLFQTSSGDPQVQGYLLVTADLSAFAGQTIRIRFAEVDNRQGLNFGVDVVSVIAKSATATVLASSAPTLPAGGAVTLTATVTGNAPTGEVAFRDGPVALPGCGAVSLAGAGNVRTAQCTTGAVTVGSHAFSASYGGDLENGVSSGGVDVTATAVPGQPCDTFADVDSAHPFCASVEWLQNRAITLGCGGNQYCPTDDVTRLSMAAFMKRLGTALTPASIVQQQPSGALNLDALPVACTTSAVASVDHAQRVSLRGVFAATATADVDIGVELVRSLDGGATWQPVDVLSHRASIAAGRWSNVALLGKDDLAVGQTARFGIAVSRGGQPGTANPSDSRCYLRVLLGNANPTSSPFDTGNPNATSPRTP